MTNEITKDILSTRGYPKVLNKISVWMVAINPVVKFALGTRCVSESSPERLDADVEFRPLNTVLEHLLGVGATPPPRPRSSSFRSRRRSSAHSGRPAAPMFSPSNGSDSLPITPRSKTLGRRPSSAMVDSGAAGKSVSGISALGSALSVVPETLARQREGVKATLRIVLRVVLTALVVFVAIVFPDFDRVMSFLGVSPILVCVFYSVLSAYEAGLFGVRHLRHHPHWRQAPALLGQGPDVQGRNRARHRPARLVVRHGRRRHSLYLHPDPDEVTVWGCSIASRAIPFGRFSP